ncbi:MAG TPA: hypothetical protein VID26_10045, partial [Candidatus Limnocylindrales bacterium]
RREPTHEAFHAGDATDDIAEDQAEWSGPHQAEADLARYLPDRLGRSPRAAVPPALAAVPRRSWPSIEGPMTLD